MAKAKRTLTEEEILAQLPAARRRWNEMLTTYPLASSARYDPATRSLHVLMRSGVGFTVPVAMIRHLSHLTDEELAEVYVDDVGFGLIWDAPNQDVSMEYLAELALGKPALMRAAGRAGGSARTPAKARAARINGRKGGRPRKLSP